MILKEYIDLTDIALKIMKCSYKDIRMVELGNQIVWEQKISAKRYFTLLKGIQKHVSIDLNGKTGARRYDLNKPINKLNNCFDMLTDFGTTEHVSNQYQVFANCNNMTRLGGMMLHVLPLYGDWPDHCNYYYEPFFFNSLALLAGYKMHLNETRYVTLHDKPNGTICIIYEKLKDGFISLEQFNRIKGLHYKKTNRLY